MLITGGTYILCVTYEIRGQIKWSIINLFQLFALIIRRNIFANKVYCLYATLKIIGKHIKCMCDFEITIIFNEENMKLYKDNDDPERIIPTHYVFNI